MYLTTIGSLGTEIIEGTCVPWGVYGSYAAEKAMIISVFTCTYLLPLMLMTFCYIRIVYTLRYKVSYVVASQPAYWRYMDLPDIRMPPDTRAGGYSATSGFGWISNV